MGLMFVFFFKQKTAYEMRISDWSSDVCSSDLRGPARADHAAAAFAHARGDRRSARATSRKLLPGRWRPLRLPASLARPVAALRAHARRAAAVRGRTSAGRRRRAGRDRLHLRRSEEHTSELQSLMRISYAVFCLKKKNNQLSHLQP